MNVKNVKIYKIVIIFFKHIPKKKVVNGVINFMQRRENESTKAFRTLFGN